MFTIELEGDSHTRGTLWRNTRRAVGRREGEGWRENNKAAAKRENVVPRPLIVFGVDCDFEIDEKRDWICYQTLQRSKA